MGFCGQMIQAILLIILLSSSAHADAETNPLVVVVLDSGYAHNEDEIPFCKRKSLSIPPPDFSFDMEVKNKHGSNVIGLIAKNAGLLGYCIININIFRSSLGRIYFDENYYRKSLEYVSKIKPAILHVSIAGGGSIAHETTLLKEILDSGTLVVASAGNKSTKLHDGKCDVYPACADERIFVIGNNDKASTNFGKIVDLEVDGNDKTAGGITLSGTSQAAAVFTGRAIKRALQKRKEHSK